jgi:hypothetical protein
MRRSLVALLILAAAGPARAQIPVTDIANTAQTVQGNIQRVQGNVQRYLGYVEQLKQVQMQLQQMDILYNNIRHYGMSRFAVDYAKSHAIELMSGSNCPNLNVYADAANGYGSSTLAYSMNMLKLAQNGCAGDIPPDLKAQLTKKAIMDAQNLNALEAIKSSKRNQRLTDTTVPESVSLAGASGSKVDVAEIALLQKAAVNTATTAAVLKDLAAQQEALLGVLMAQSMYQTDQITEALNSRRDYNAQIDRAITLTSR